MRYYSILLGLVLLPLISFSQQYEYRKVTVSIGGSDNFSINKDNSESATGKIILRPHRLLIDDRSFDLKRKEKNLFRTKAGFVRLVYNDVNELCQLYITRFNTSYCYHIKTAENSVAKTN